MEVFPAGVPAYRLGSGASNREALGDRVKRALLGVVQLKDLAQQKILLVDGRVLRKPIKALLPHLLLQVASDTLISAGPQTSKRLKGQGSLSASLGDVCPCWVRDKCCCSTCLGHN
jgi:hypothetical protein